MRAETMVTPEVFASHLCDDMRLPYNGFYKEIVSQLRRHIEDAQLNENYSGHLGDDLSKVKEQNLEWYKHHVTSRFGSAQWPVGPVIEENGVNSPRAEASANEELRVTIRVGLTVLYIWRASHR
jgi:SWI/SNF-related matrix-associated actin-dependent regulator of chromatin subfamily B protein 1